MPNTETVQWSGLSWSGGSGSKCVSNRIRNHSRTHIHNRTRIRCVPVWRVLQSQTTPPDGNRNRIDRWLPRSPSCTIPLCIYLSPARYPPRVGGHWLRRRLWSYVPPLRLAISWTPQWSTARGEHAQGCLKIIIKLMNSPSYYKTNHSVLRATHAVVFKVCLYTKLQRAKVFLIFFQSTSLEWGFQ